MKVLVEQVHAGCILMNDVFSTTDSPIIKGQTVLTDVHVAVLKAFSIREVDVHPLLANGEVFAPAHINESQDNDISGVDDAFITYYLQAVKQYREMFESFRETDQIDFLAIKKIMNPLFIQVNNDPTYLLTLHHYCNKEDYYYHHSVYVGMLSFYLSCKMQYSLPEAKLIGYVGSLADIGMAKLPVELLEKSGLLTTNEYEQLKKHPIVSYKMLKDVEGISDSMLIAVLQHHERLDGSGYPLGLEAERIHVFSQIIAVADVYHAMTSERVYRSKQSPYKVLEEIYNKQFGKFEIRVVEALLKNLIQVSIGNRIKLTSGDVAEIIFVDQQMPTRPIVKVIETGEIISLTKELDLHIEELLLNE